MVEHVGCNLAAMCDKVDHCTRRSLVQPPLIFVALNNEGIPFPPLLQELVREKLAGVMPVSCLDLLALLNLLVKAYR